MTALEDYVEQINHYEALLGRHRGQLAVALDAVTSAMILAGQHAVYCHSSRDADKPALDIRQITRDLEDAKELIQNVMEKIRAERDSSGIPAPRSPLL